MFAQGFQFIVHVLKAVYEISIYVYFRDRKLKSGV